MYADKCNLPENSINYLQDLIQVNIDSRDGFEAAAAHLRSEGRADLELLFKRVANERAAQVRELQSLVACNAESPTTGGSVAAAAHRTWLGLREALGGGQQAILDEVERGEDHIREKYEVAIKDLGSCTCTETLRRQYERVRASHDQIRNLRDLCAQSSPTEHHQL